MPRLRVLTRSGMEFVEVADREERSVLGGYWNAVRKFLGTGDEDLLTDFEGQSVAGKPLLTEPYQIEVWARQGELGFEDIYKTTWEGG